MSNLFEHEAEVVIQRLISDGAQWRSQLPDSEQVASRIQSIPWTTQPTIQQTELPSTIEHMGGHMYMDEQTGPKESHPGEPRRGTRTTRRLRSVLAVAAAIVVVALLAGVLARMAQLTHHNGAGANATTTPSLTTTRSDSRRRSGFDPLIEAGLPCPRRCWCRSAIGW